MVELAVPLVCCVVVRDPLTYLLPSPLAVGKRAVLNKVMRLGELFLLLNCCSIWRKRLPYLTWAVR